MTLKSPCLRLQCSVRRPDPPAQAEHWRQQRLQPTKTSQTPLQLQQLRRTCHPGCASVRSCCCWRYCCGQRLCCAQPMSSHAFAAAGAASTTPRNGTRAALGTACSAASIHPAASSGTARGRLADIELQLVMHGLKNRELLQFARCNRRMLHAADCSRLARLPAHQDGSLRGDYHDSDGTAAGHLVHA